MCGSSDICLNKSKYAIFGCEKFALSYSWLKSRVFVHINYITLGSVTFKIDKRFFSQCH